MNYSLIQHHAPLQRIHRGSPFFTTLPTVHRGVVLASGGTRSWAEVVAASGSWDGDSSLNCMTWLRLSLKVVPTSSIQPERSSARFASLSPVNPHRPITILSSGNLARSRLQR